MNFLQKQHNRYWNVQRKRDVKSILEIAVSQPDSNCVDGKEWAKEAQKGKDVSLPFLSHRVRP